MVWRSSVTLADREPLTFKQTVANGKWSPFGGYTAPSSGAGRKRGSPRSTSPRRRFIKFSLHVGLHPGSDGSVAVSVNVIEPRQWTLMSYWAQLVRHSSMFSRESSCNMFVKQWRGRKKAQKKPCCYSFFNFIFLFNKSQGCPACQTNELSGEFLQVDRKDPFIK